ncbi:hypothetical protein PITCH_A980027 [uncultured Desulfobacterium sp.]|uniref:Uncharacterized protein n=1 Tax=uncultured Desulfobacterium sp. TaxID=201089 RepID=A0A445N4A4_9BACT|nr:hypothetical protein PITCH_A980027 [uncultured Desulfobacterium sp.]
MNEEDKKEKKLTIKVPKGTIVKIEGHPVRLRESLYIEQVNGASFRLEDHIVMETEEEE